MAENEFGGGFGVGAGYTTGTGATNVSLGDASPNAPAAPATPEPVRDISTAEFMPLVIEGSAQTPVLVDFWAPWCEPCKQLAPILEKLVGETNGRLRLVKMNIEEHPEVSTQMGIQSIPAVVAFVDGKPAEAFMGVKSETEIRAFIEKLIGPSGPDPSDVMLEQAALLADEGALAEAAKLYGEVLQLEPGNLKALSGLGQLHLEDGNDQAVEEMLGTLDDEQLKSPEIASLTTALELREQAADIGNRTELQDAVDADPGNHQARFDLAIALNAANERDEAAAHLLEIVAGKPDWNGEAARKQLLQFFEAWGLTDAATNAARRKLSSLLFS